MKSLRTKLAAVVIAAAAIIAAPAAANAYTPVAPGGANQTVAPGGTVTVPFTGFAPNDTVTFVLTGENAAGATLAAVKTAVNTKTIAKVSSASGAVSVAVTLPTNATGSYRLVGTGAAGGVAEATIVAGAAGGLPATGVDSASLMGVWIGGGVLLLGGLAVTVFAVRRQRETV
ncbi:LPXTG cell wall anchor domain-containing protein [Microbacterium sp. cx-55]|uniref:LPXTG cell wall anchor domain-containing protein n=1 Tax=unclassified Microbacterium TaxID=2609290 RepID=UPI001CBC88BF|nr:MULTISPECIES: LPXTG cell wall anchor domain-containing protein [unclassified Microbacterium]MBZ4487618.1 LPXTG cell wall anchor domain-containing protein [Microbacterium sp. cx-55]MCC4908230.1 LPXTG cell wall anchor domain-containing protein [Microbacterium sp. cx-59]UGB35631.1 LPXTG cell wall anchor domain-containing protein [Microbacterium sp. cx-55]